MSIMRIDYPCELICIDSYKPHTYVSALSLSAHCTLSTYVIVHTFIGQVKVTPI